MSNADLNPHWEQWDQGWSWHGSDCCLIASSDRQSKFFQFSKLSHETHHSAQLIPSSSLEGYAYVCVCVCSFWLLPAHNQSLEWSVLPSSNWKMDPEKNQRDAWSVNQQTIYRAAKLTLATTMERERHRNYKEQEGIRSLTAYICTFHHTKTDIKSIPARTPRTRQSHCFHPTLWNRKLKFREIMQPA